MTAAKYNSKKQEASEGQMVTETTPTKQAKKQPVKAFSVIEVGGVYKCLEIDLDIGTNEVYSVKVVEQNTDVFIIKNRMMICLEQNEMV